MTITESYTSIATQAREATEKSVAAFKQGTQTVTEQARTLAKLPTVDLTTSVTRYFHLVQTSVDLNRDLATRWAQLVTTVSESVRSQADSFRSIVEDQTEKVAELTVRQAEKAEELVKETAERVDRATRERTEAIEAELKAEVRRAKAAEREEAKKAAEKAREPYAGLTKAELADRLSARDLHKTGTVDELIDRLVAADIR